MGMEKVKILLVDDQPGKLASYEVILAELDETLLKAASAQEALQLLLKHDVAVILVDVCMPDLDGFELAQMIREHPRYREIAIIFISAILLSEMDSLRGYEMGAVDYVSVPVVPAVLRAKVRVFTDLHRKTRELSRINGELERRVAERTSELESAIARQELLAREVDHRAKNALAVIQAIVSIMPPAPGPEFARAVDGRIRAMARAHTLLSQSRWEGADLASLVDEELEPYRAGERVAIDGPSVGIKPTVAQNFALAIHELATNAAKYGALSSPSGQLSVSWTVAGDELLLDWRETNGPSVVKPARRGFGSKVIEASVTSQLGGKIDYRWPESGLVVSIRIPEEHFTPPHPKLAKAAPVREEGVGGPLPELQGKRVLLVEDEPLVAMMMGRTLTDLGCEVVGPIATLAEAMSKTPFQVDAAVLDVNVAGELIYPLALRLKAQGVGLVFVTGYEADSIDPRFAGAPVLTKPIEAAELAAALAGVTGPTLTVGGGSGRSGRGQASAAAG
jgi:two-component sensor histidine kinase